MDFSTNRRLAAVILLISVVFFTFFGVGRSLNKAAKDISGHFETGSYNAEGKYTEKSIQSHLDSRVNAANGLLSLDGQFSRVLESSVNLGQARIALIDAETLPDKYRANADLTTYSEELYTALAGADLSKDQKEMLDYYINTLRGAQSAIEKLSYNSEVEEFYSRTLKSFPASVFASILNIDGPEYFAPGADN